MCYICRTKGMVYLSESPLITWLIYHKLVVNKVVIVVSKIILFTDIRASTTTILLYLERCLTLYRLRVDRFTHILVVNKIYPPFYICNERSEYLINSVDRIIDGRYRSKRHEVDTTSIPTYRWCDCVCIWGMCR